MSAQVDVVIVSHDSGTDLVRAVASALAQEPTPNVIVVDNASADQGPVDAVELMGAHVERLAENTGFAEGANIGMALGSAPLIVLLNPDAELEARALTEVRGAATRRPDAGMFAFAVHLRDGRLETVGHHLSPGGLNGARGHGDPRALTEETDVGVPSGAAMAVRRVVIREVGGFVPGWFAYGDEADLALRARRAGWRTRAVPSARAIHAGSADTAWKAYLVERNRIWVWASHLPIRRGLADSAIRITWMGTGAARGRGALGSIGTRALLGATIRAWRDALAGLPYAVRRRRGLGGDARGAAEVAVRHRLPVRWMPR